MATLTIKTSTGFNTNEAFAFSHPQTTWKNPLLWIVKDSFSGMSHRWMGTGFTYDADGNITGGNATSLSVIDAAGSVHASVKFATPWNFATQGLPGSYGDLLTGDDVVIGGAGNDVLGGGNGLGTNANDVYSYNGHTYLLSNAGTWTEAEAQAVSLGGHLVTINDQAEQDWVFSSFKDVGNWLLWIGYTDQKTEGVWKWISGENSTYTNWNSGEPNNAGAVGEDYAHLYTPYYGYTYYTGRWNDLPNLDVGDVGGTAMRGIIELNNNNTNNGEDTLKGGLGNDIYTVNSSGDKVIEMANSGTDTVNSSMTYKLTANVENLTLTGSETLKGLGNDLDNIITGNSAANVLLGYDGNDTLIGDLGDDKLTGSIGDDTLQGDSGIDTAIYSGVSSSYHLEYINNVLQVTDTDSVDGNYGVDTLTGVEALQFSDKTVYTNAVDIFKTQLLTAAEKQVVGGENVGMIRTMADFSKAAYALQSWEDNTTFHTGLNSAFNDKSDNADTAYQDVLSQGWQPLTLGSQVNGTFTCIDHSGDYGIVSIDNNAPRLSFQTVNGMAGGYYTQDNAAAFVARCGDAVVLSFRGTNDNRAGDSDPATTPDSGVINPDDRSNTITPDVDQWGNLGDSSDQSMSNHYALFSTLITALDSYVSTNGINHVYVTGHSLGGAMAIEYMAEHTGNQYQAITFAAPAFTETDYHRKAFNADPRISQIEIAKDPVPMTWDVADVDNNDRPGNVIRLSGDHTLDTPDHYAGWTPVAYDGNANNHSMDYYRAITDNIDAGSWQTILAQTGDQEVYLGGTRAVSNRVETFTVATNADVLAAPTDSNYNIFYGGFNNDTLTGGGTNELLIGGQGKDVLRGDLGADTFVFNQVSDSAAGKLRDIIIDFLNGTDKIDLSEIDANNTTTENDPFLSLALGVTNVTFNATNSLYFNTASHILYGNNDIDTAADFSILLSGVTSLTTNDFIL